MVENLHLGVTNTVIVPIVPSKTVQQKIVPIVPTYRSNRAHFRALIIVPIVP